MIAFLDRHKKREITSPSMFKMAEQVLGELQKPNASIYSSNNTNDTFILPVNLPFSSPEQASILADYLVSLQHQHGKNIKNTPIKFETTLEKTTNETNIIAICEKCDAKSRKEAVIPIKKANKETQELLLKNKRWKPSFAIKNNLIGKGGMELKTSFDKISDANKFILDITTNMDMLRNFHGEKDMPPSDYPRVFSENSDIAKNHRITYWHPDDNEKPPFHIFIKTEVLAKLKKLEDPTRYKNSPGR